MALGRLTRRRRAAGASAGRRRLGAKPGLCVLAAIVLLCLVAPWFLPYGATELTGDAPLLGPSTAHWMGTDELGRDLLSRVLVGGRISLVVSAGATLVAMIVGVAWGLAAALGRPLVDNVLMRAADTAMAIPQILFALVFVAAFGSSALGLALVIGVLLVPTTARMARAVALTEIESDYYAAAVAYGASPSRLVLRELLPNMWSPLAVQASVNAAHAIMLEAALSFIGLGVAPPSASWGTLVRQGYDHLYEALWYSLCPALAIVLTIWMLNWVGDALGGSDDPRARLS